MNENTPNSGTRPGNGAETDALALLIRAAGHREAPPDEAYQQVLAATRGTWQRKVRRRTYWRVANAIAASVARSGSGLPRVGITMVKSRRSSVGTRS